MNWSLASTSEIIQNVRTPLALAALFILLGSVVVRQLLRRAGRPNTDTRAVLTYGFILALVIAVLAIASFVYTAGFEREIRISGVVCNAQLVGLPFATVRIPGREGGITNATGDFAFTVPDSRAADQYILDVSCDGYVAKQCKLEGRYPQPATVILQPSPVSLDNVIALPSTLVVRHTLGVPQVELSMTFRNPLSKNVSLDNIDLILTSPTKKQIPVAMELMCIIPGQILPPSRGWKLEKEPVSATYSFFNSNQRFIELEQKAYAEISPKQSTITAPDPSAILLSASLVKELREFMQSEFIWTAGTWEIHVTCRIEGARAEAVATFSLSNDDVKRMRAIADFYPAALGVAPNWRFWQSAEVNPSVTAVLNSK